MIVSCPAKINLTLEVLQRQPDGYHALRTLMVPLALHDTLSITESSSFSFTCSNASLAGRDNLVVQAVSAISPALPPVAVSLDKQIPTQAGLGGGSSDAAGLLLAAMRDACGTLPPTDWLTVARSLGSDVPFFLTETAALVEGTGERVTAIGELPPWHVLIVKPPVAISTAAAYEKLSRISRPTRPRNTSVTLQALDALQRGDFPAVEALLSNDFTDVTDAPEVATALSALQSAGASNTLLSGSGSAVFTIAPNQERIEEIAERLDLPFGFLCFETSFARTPAWRGARE